MRKLLFLVLISFNILLGFDTLSVSNIREGLDYFHIVNRDTSNLINIHLLRLKFPNKNIRIGVGVANDKIGGAEKTTDYCKRHPEVIAAVNGDFFGGDPIQAQNIIMNNGKLLKGVKRNRTVFASNDEEIFIKNIKINGKLFVEEDTIQLDGFNEVYEKGKIIVYDSNYVFNKIGGTDTIRFCIEEGINLNRKLKLLTKTKNENFFLLADSAKIINLRNKIIQKSSILFEIIEQQDYKNIIGGLPKLVEKGKKPISYLGMEGITSEGFIKKHPRTAVGFDENNDFLYIVVVDGRQKGYSTGMTLSELAEFLINIGVGEALNLDGGGSSTMVVEGKLINKPSDILGERKVCNYLILTKTK